MVIINEADIKNIFHEIITKRITREEAANKVMEIQKALDMCDLEFYPKEKEVKIWDAILFIGLFAEKIDNDTYLYSSYDLTAYMMEYGWDI